MLYEINKIITRIIIWFFFLSFEWPCWSVWFRIFFRHVSSYFTLFWLSPIIACCTQFARFKSIIICTSIKI